jgi:hypothetical protein
MLEPPSTSPTEVYDHTVPGQHRGGVAMLASFFFFGGGQLVKRQFRRFLTLWAILIAVVAFELTVAWMLPEYLTLMIRGSIVSVVVLWLFQILDALTHW